MGLYTYLKIEKNNFLPLFSKVKSLVKHFTNMAKPEKQISYFIWPNELQIKNVLFFFFNMSVTLIKEVNVGFWALYVEVPEKLISNFVFYFGPISTYILICLLFVYYWLWTLVITYVFKILTLLLHNMC